MFKVRESPSVWLAARQKTAEPPGRSLTPGPSRRQQQTEDREQHRGPRHGSDIRHRPGDGHAPRTLRDTVFAGAYRTSDQELADLAAVPASRGRLQRIDIDVTDAVSIQRACAQITGTLPDGWSFAFVNNAEVAFGSPFEVERLEMMRLQMEVKYVRVVQVVRGFLPLRQRTQGRIINWALPDSAWVGLATLRSPGISGHLGAVMCAPRCGCREAGAAFGVAIDNGRTAGSPCAAGHPRALRGWRTRGDPVGPPVGPRRAEAGGPHRRRPGP